MLNFFDVGQVEWSGGSETVTEALAKIHHREEAALRRERALAYAFTRQVCLVVVSIDFFIIVEPKKQI